jgi:hypothetical protein
MNLKVRIVKIESELEQINRVAESYQQELQKLQFEVIKKNGALEVLKSLEEEQAQELSAKEITVNGNKEITE